MKGRRAAAARPASRPLRPVPVAAPGKRLPDSVELLDIAFRRASKATPRSDSRSDRNLLRARLKILRSSATLLRHLRSRLAFADRPPLTGFQKSLVDGRFGAGTLDRSIARVRRAAERIRGLTRESEGAIDRAAPDPEEIGREVRAFYGRVSSHVREIDRDLARLREIHGFLKARPRLDPAEPSVVVAGFPNVGKSSLVARLSSARPEIADYPFTTRSIAVGHADLGFDRLQVVDTPGILGRARTTNPIEREAEAAMAGAATIVLFLLDPSESSGYPLAEQEALLARWRENRPDLTILEVETKSDLARRSAGRLAVSSVTGEGVPELLRTLKAILRDRLRSAPGPEG
ncbi:MAG: GTPase [Thermoplasmata archaeon]